MTAFSEAIESMRLRRTSMVNSGETEQAEGVTACIAILVELEAKRPGVIDITIAGPLCPSYDAPQPRCGLSAQCSSIHEGGLGPCPVILARGRKR